MARWQRSFLAAIGGMAGAAAGFRIFEHSSPIMAALGCGLGAALGAGLGALAASSQN